MLVMEYVELGSLSSYLRLHEDELIEETNKLLKYSLDVAQVIFFFVLSITYKYLHSTYILLLKLS